MDMVLFSLECYFKVIEKENEREKKKRKKETNGQCQYENEISCSDTLPFTQLTGMIQSHILEHC